MWASDGGPGHSLQRGTDLGLPDATVKNLCDGWTEDERNWHRRTLQLAHHGRAWAHPAVRGLLSSMRPTDGSTLPRNSTILTLGLHPIWILPPTPQLEKMPTSVTATAFGPQPPFLFHHLTNLPHKICNLHGRHGSAST